MTHSCMLKNQPKMMLMAMEGDALKFDLAKDRHMHSLRIMMEGRDQIFNL